MDPVKVKELKKYLSPGPGWVIFGAILLATGVPLLFVLGVAAVVYLIFGAVLLWIGISGRKDVSRQLQRFEEQGELGRVLEDFEHARPYVKDKIRVGNAYLFGKSKEKVVAYRDVCRLYQHIRKRYGIENSRSLKYVNPQGKTETLCDIQTRGKSDDAINEIGRIIAAHNPSVKFGYQK